MWSGHESLQFYSTRSEQNEMESFSFNRKVFRVYGVLPLDGGDFGRFKCLEFLRVILLPLPSFLMAIAQLAYFVVNIRDLGKATVALYCGFGFLNAIFGYSLAIYHRRKFLKLINDMQATVDRSKIQIFVRDCVPHEHLNDFQESSVATNASIFRWTNYFVKYRW